jgi:hypothetical protein
LGYEVQKLRANLDRGRLFVEAEALPAKAKLLYDELARLETANPAQLKTEYERINQELGASAVDRITSLTNSSRIPFRSSGSDTEAGGGSPLLSPPYFSIPSISSIRRRISSILRRITSKGSSGTSRSTGRARPAISSRRS